MLVALEIVLLLLVIDQHASAQPGFLNIDCGGTSSYVDELGLSWTPDDHYIATGITTSVSEAQLKSTPRHLQRLRYFPNSSQKHCYALPVGFNQTYLVRPWFYYGNYNNLGSYAVDFNIIIGATRFRTISVQSENSFYVYLEIVVKTDDETLDFCLASLPSSPPSSAPYISAIEMRLLESEMYRLSNSSQGLIKLKRIYVGAHSTNDIRYPNDKYDRLWSPDKGFPSMISSRNYTSVSTSLSVSPGTTANQPPSAVMSTGITSTGTIIFEFPVTTTNDNCYFTFYFAELEDLGGNTTREFNALVFNGSQTLPLSSIPLNIEKLAAGPRRSLELDLFYSNLTKPSFQFVPTKTSTLGPLINAAEAYTVLTNLSPGTQRSDKIAIASILSHFNISEYSGDPCLPDPYFWSMITCDTTEHYGKITELNLSNYHLHGAIPHEIQNLVHLTKIFLDNNMLKGRVPDFSSLRNLTTLHLNNNNFSGRVPTSLLRIQDLSIQNNNFDCIPHELAPSFNGTTSICHSNKHLNNPKKIIGGVIAGVVVILLVVVGLYFWLSRKRKSDQVVKSGKLALVETPSFSPKPSSTSKTFSYREIVKATDSFKRVLGEGSFGPVYHGRLSNGSEIAVKVLSASSSQGEKEFNTEIEVLSIVHHKNLVFFGSCKEGSKLMLVYEYLSNGTLREHLYGGQKETLTWKRRLEILLDAAQVKDLIICTRPAMYTSFTVM